MQNINIRDHSQMSSTKTNTNVDQIGAKWDKYRTFSGQISIYFGSVSKNSKYTGN